MKKLNIFLLIVSVCICFLPVYATTTGKIAEPARPMPYTDFLTIESTAQTSIATITQLLSDGGYALIHNESGGMLRVGTDTAALTNGFGVPAGGVLSVRCYKGQAVYLDCSTSADISYIKELKNLEYLNLRNNPISDFSVLKELKNLIYLYLSKNQIDENQKAELKQVLPNLKIVY